MYFEEKQYYNAATLYACYEICDMINHSLQINKDNQFGGKDIIYFLLPVNRIG